MTPPRKEWRIWLNLPKAKVKSSSDSLRERLALTTKAIGSQKAKV